MGLFDRFKKSDDSSPKNVTTIRGDGYTVKITTSGTPYAAPIFKVPAEGPTPFRDTDGVTAFYEAPAIAPDEMRLQSSSAPGGVVGGTERHQDLLGSLPPSLGWYFVELLNVGDVVEARMNGQTIGSLSPKSSQKYRRLIERAHADGKRLTSVAILELAAKGWKVTLRASPIEEGQTNVGVLDIAISDNMVLRHRSKTVHYVKEKLANGDWQTTCNTVVPSGEGESIGSTSVGRVYMSNLELAPWFNQCDKCRPPS